MLASVHLKNWSPPSAFLSSWLGLLICFLSWYDMLHSCSLTGQASSFGRLEANLSRWVKLMTCLRIQAALQNGLPGMVSLLVGDPNQADCQLSSPPAWLCR